MDLPPDVAAVPLDLLATMVQGALAGAATMHEQDLAATRRRQRAASASAVDRLGGRQLVGLLGRRVSRRLRPRD